MRSVRTHTGKIEQTAIRPALPPYPLSPTRLRRRRRVQLPGQSMDFLWPLAIPGGPRPGANGGRCRRERRRARCMSTLSRSTKKLVSVSSSPVSLSACTRTTRAFHGVWFTLTGPQIYVFISLIITVWQQQRVALPLTHSLLRVQRSGRDQAALGPPLQVRVFRWSKGACQCTSSRDCHPLLRHIPSSTRLISGRST